VGVTRRLVAGGLLGVLFSLLSFTPTLAQTPVTTPFQFSVPDTQLTVQGYSAPGALVTLREAGSTIGSVVANNSSGYFTTTLGSQSSGLRSIDVYFDDSEGVRSSVSSQSISVQPQQQTTVDLFLSPTITRRTPQQVQLGSLVQINGYTAVGAKVTLSLGSSSSERTVNANNSGFYEFLYDTTGLGVSSYTASVVSDISSPSIQSEASRAVSFDVVSVTGPTAPDIVVSPDQLPPPIPLFPSDGAQIDGDSVTVSGESLPNAQINIYENGVVVGSIFADENGKWAFEYKAVLTSTTLSFEACLDGRCSVLSATVTLNFSSFGKCDTDFNLRLYRFWGVSVGQSVELEFLNVSGGFFTVDWGDGTVEEFSFYINQSKISKKYERTGQYNGSIKLSQNGCDKIRYFSVNVDLQVSNLNFQRLSLLLGTVFAVFLINHIANKDKK